MIFMVLVVLLLATYVRFGRWLDARRRYQPALDDELPADYGMNPERPWERRPRQRARLAH